MSRVHNTNRTTIIAAVGLGLLLALAGCQIPHDESQFYARGGPEALLDVSSEVVNLSVAGKDELRQLSSWISGDHPTRAELFCDVRLKNCKTASAILRAKGIETNLTPSPDNMVTLVYERILARDCNPRFIDSRRIRLSNEPAPTFGCSLSANIVQHVSDKREFINPSLMDNPSAVGGVSVYHRAYKPSTEEPAKYTVEQSAVKTKTE